MESKNLAAEEAMRQIRNVPPPPKKPVPMDTRSFAVRIDTKVYLLDGTTINDTEDDTREFFEELVRAGVEQGLSKTVAESRAYEVRKDRFGVGKEHGFYGEEVKPWFPGNFAVLLAPVKHVHTLNYLNSTGETIDQTVTKIMWVMGKQYAIATGKDTTNFERDEFGGIMVPGVGVLYGTLENEITDLVARLLAMHGRVVGKDARGQYITEPTTYDEVISHLPPGFVQMQIGTPEKPEQVFDEVLRITTVFNTDILQAEIEAENPQDDDLKK